MTIAWFSRHEPTSRQLTALKSMFGSGLRIEQDCRAFDGATDIIARYNKSQCHDIVVVAPLAVVQALTKAGLQPLWAEMKTCTSSHPEKEVTVTPKVGKPRHYRFIKFWRITGIHFELIDPLTKEEHTHGNDSCQTT